MHRSMKDESEAVACANGITSHSATLVGPFARDKLQPTALDVHWHHELLLLVAFGLWAVVCMGDHEAEGN